MTTIIFNLMAAAAGTSMIIFRKTLANKIELLNEGFAAANDGTRSRRTHLFSRVLFAIGTGILCFGILNLSGITEIGLILFLNVVLISPAVYMICLTKDYKGFQKITLGILAGIFFAIVLVFNFSTYKSTKPVELTMYDNQLSVYSFGFGVEADVKDIKQVMITDHLPEINLRLNGLSLGKYQRGLYSLKDNSTVHIFLETNRPKFLNIKFNHANDIYLNYDPNDPIQQQLVNLGASRNLTTENTEEDTESTEKCRRVGCNSLSPIRFRLKPCGNEN